MVDYSSMKVPELKKLLSERSLPQSGNKADLIARLQEYDKQQAAKNAEPQADSKKPAPAEDEIDYEDDDLPATTTTTTATKDNKDTVAEKPAATENAPSAVSAPTASTEEKKTEPAATTSATTSEKAAEEKKTEDAATAKTTSSFTQNLPPTDAKTEAEKRAARAARFGLDVQSEEAKKAARAARFGLPQEAVAALDSALPERAPRKRGRSGEGDSEARDNKRRDRHGPAGRNHQGRVSSGRHQPRRGGGGGGNRGNGYANARKGNNNGPKPAVKKIADDPVERAKMEARAKRFAAKPASS